MAEEKPNPEERPVQRRVSRQFRAEVDLAGIEIPDWEFITKLVDLFHPYVLPAEEIDTFVLRGNDSRGSYSAPDLDAFKEEHAERGEALESFSIEVYGKDEHGLYGLSVHYTNDFGKADFDGGNEVMVNGIAVRVEKLAEAARARVKAKEAEALRVKRPAPMGSLEEPGRTPEPVPVTVVGPEPQKSSVWTHPWIVGIGTAVVAALIVAAIIWAVSR